MSNNGSGTGTLPLYLFYSDKARDHVVSTQSPGDGYDQLPWGSVGHVFKGPTAMGDGIILQGNDVPLPALADNVIAQHVQFPKGDWDLTFRLQVLEHKAGSLLRFADSKGGQQLRVELKKTMSRNKKGEVETKLLLTVTAAGNEIVGPRPILTDRDYKVSVLFIGGKVSLYVDTCRDGMASVTDHAVLTGATTITSAEPSGEPAAAVVHDLTLFPSKPVSEWELHTNFSARLGTDFAIRQGCIQFVHSAHFGNRKTGEFVNVTDRIRNRVKDGGISCFRVTHDSVGVKTSGAPEDTFLVTVYTPSVDFAPDRGNTGVTVVPLYQMWNKTTENHVLTKDPQPFECMGYSQERIEGYAYEAPQTQRLLSEIEIYENRDVDDTCTVVDLKTLERLRSLNDAGEYTLKLPQQGCVAP